MKQNNNNNRRARGRGPRKPHGMGGGGHNKGQGYEGGGQELRVRGNAYQVLEKYLQLARDAGSAGDRVAAENFLQHADHYYRVLSAMNDGQRPRMGGRELSVADVNVQNVSQGLSAALYSSGGPNPQGGSDSEMQGEGMPGQNPGNQGESRHPRPPGQPGSWRPAGPGWPPARPPRPAGWPSARRPPARSSAGGRSHEAQHQQPSGNVAQTNGHDGNNYGNYADREEAQPTYSAPTEPPRAAAPGPAEDQPDYPDELLPVAAAAAPAAPQAPDDAEDGVQRTLRAPRPRLRGPRRGPRQGDGRPGGGSGQADPE